MVSHAGIMLLDQVGYAGGLKKPMPRQALF
jgi:hypothetical protein